MTMVNAAWSSWTFGFGFGHRGFLALLPVMTLTVAPAVGDLAPGWAKRFPDARLRRMATLAVGLLVAWNVYVWVGFNVIVTR
jgi:hypothetical protein